MTLPLSIDPDARIDIMADPLNIKSRLYKEVSVLLTALSHDDSITTRERIAALAAIPRTLTLLLEMSKENADAPDRGSAVRKYATAFKAHGARRGKAGPGDPAESRIASLIQMPRMPARGALPN